VTDSGAGLPSGDPERVFEAFFTTKPQGTGMGLTICRRIVEAHGGRLVAIPNRGRGATFQFTLPVGSTASLL
jgi:signal transduction histidine kinase